MSGWRRRQLKAFLSAQPLAADVTVTPAELGGVPTADITVDGILIKTRHVVLYFHGGVYVLGDAFLAADLASQIGRRTSARVISVDYRLAPEHPYPAAVDDALAAYAYSANAPRPETVDGLEQTFAVNTLAPYLSTALIARPHRLVFMTSDLHQSGEPDLSDLRRRQRLWSGSQAYSNSKLFVVALAFGVARLWPDVLSNAVNPGWVATRMGGPQAPDDFEQVSRRRSGWR
jgi:NAD(P)-dependent dehydrogenase (short-subunit alcohol dehydrogenase family)